MDAHPLIPQLTLEEKASLCIGADFWHTRAVDRLGIASIKLSDGPHGLRTHAADADPTSLGGSLPATCFPTASALGSSWDADLARQVGVALGREARAFGVSVLLGPGINIKRSPLCGRNFEYLSEDPRVAGVLGAAMAEGVQSQGVGTSVKHFAANNQETDRLRVSADVDERALREIYLPAFERVVTQARPWTVMCAYNKVNGTYASEHHWLLTEVLRDEWGFDGLVVSDWGAVHDRVAALAGGLDLEMPPKLGLSDKAIVAAVRAGELDESLLDLAVTRVLALVERAPTAPGEPFDIDAHHALARSVAIESAVLLKNDGDLLPLRPAVGDRIAVIGELARTPRYQGAGSSRVNPTQLDIALDEFRKAVPAGVEVGFAPGYALDDPGADAALAAEAVDLARDAGTAVLFLGLPDTEESEGFDREHIDLPGNQLALLRRVAEVHERIVVVLANGSVVRVEGWQQHASALLECWLSGQAAGGAVADLLLGKANPSGRLAETIPLRLEDNPSYLSFPGDSGHVAYGEGIFVGYRGYDRRDQAVSYPFGYGLSYTTFEYAELRVEVSGRHETGDLSIAVSCAITNTGAVAGKEVVQLYVGDAESTVARPVRELCGFAKVALEPGQTTTVTMILTARDLSFWSSVHRQWVLEEGQFELAVGASSRDLRLRRTVYIDAPRLATPLGPMSTLQEWLADPDGAMALAGLFAAAPSGLELDENVLRMMGAFPLSTLATFPGTGLTPENLDELIASVNPLS